MKKLNIGCGKDIKKGYVNLDTINLPGVDIVHSLDKTPYPFKENEFSEVYASHILEHTKDLVKTMEEIHRICENSARIKIKVPYFASSSAFQDPTHFRFFTTRTFNYFDPKNPNNFITSARFKTIKIKLLYTRQNWVINKPLEYIMNKFQKFYERAFCFIIPFHEIHYELEVIK